MKKSKIYSFLISLISFCFLLIQSCAYDEEIKPDLSNEKNTVRALDQNATAGV